MTTDYLTVAFSWKSRKWQNSFPENKFTRFGHIRTNNADLRGPENGKTHFRKTSLLVLTTSAQIMPTFGVPKMAKLISGKQVSSF